MRFTPVQRDFHIAIAINFAKDIKSNQEGIVINTNYDLSLIKEYLRYKRTKNKRVAPDTGDRYPDSLYGSWLKKILLNAKQF